MAALQPNPSLDLWEREGARLRATDVKLRASEACAIETRLLAGQLAHLAGFAAAKLAIIDRCLAANAARDLA